MDATGCGRPASFAGTDADSLSCSRNFETFISAVHLGADIALDWAMWQPTSWTSRALDGAFGADLSDQVDGIKASNSGVHTMLLRLTAGGSFDVVMNTARGSRLEAYRRLARRYEPSTGGRPRNLSRAIIQPVALLLTILKELSSDGKNKFDAVGGCDTSNSRWRHSSPRSLRGILSSTLGAPLAAPALARKLGFTRESTLAAASRKSLHRAPRRPRPQLPRRQCHGSSLGRPHCEGQGEAQGQRQAVSGTSQGATYQRLR